MNNNDSDDEHQEIIIVRRGGGDHDEHHGGVWKIAFADFMTAMMAFFLVMWLINASNEKTKKAVASYFNPIELMDTTTNPKGVKDPKYGVKTSEVDSDIESDDTSVFVSERVLPTKSQLGAYFDEQALFVDPLALLAEIAAGVRNEGASSEVQLSDKNLRSDNLALSDGTEYRDPFDPQSWQKNELQFSGNKIEDEENDGKEKPQTMTGEDAEEVKDAKDTMFTKWMQGIDPGQDDEISDDSQMVESKLMEQNENHQEKAEINADTGEAREPNAEFDKKLEALKKLAESNFSVEMIELDNEYKIVLSENGGNGMFDVGSARPKSTFVAVMGDLGKVLAESGGKVVVSGHTDARQYKKKIYDNWRLSSDRAHMAYYMLLRGGMVPKQMERIEGYADTNLKDVSDPLAASNRRIEVLLQKL